MVVVGIETVVAQVLDARDELVELRRVLPGRLELLRLVVLCDQLVGDHACPAHVLLLLVAQMVDAVADGFRQRIGDGGDRSNRHRLRGLLRQRGNGREQCRGQDGHDGEGRSMCHAGEFQESQARAIFACRS